ncbi:hypothetical protein [Atlantibacter hermannii]|uniref:hypothetical protein n=1 Tax=Atlantibacter hermannii TaxID=565 RepID=UPI0019331618|nr:hypothetical protein [Atlantibacter hermannii]MBL7676426.1 hypothetical protein [Atlantibacter hermannii]
MVLTYRPAGHLVLWIKFLVESDPFLLTTLNGNFARCHFFVVGIEVSAVSALTIHAFYGFMKGGIDASFNSEIIMFYRISDCQGRDK